MYSQKHTVTLATSAGGVATGYTPVVTGQIVNVVYTKVDFDNGVDITVTTEDSTQNLWVESDVNASKTVSPQQATHSTVGVAALYAAGGSAVLGPIYAAGERIKIAVAQGGNVKSGTFTVILA